MKLVVPPLVALSVTAGPLTWLNAVVVTVPLSVAVAVIVTRLPELVAPVLPTVTVGGASAATSSSPHAASKDPPNTAIAVAEIPLRSAWRRE
jgi:hypothetical protein